MILWRYARRTMLRWQQYAVIGMDKEQALQTAREGHDVYDANWLQVSSDGGVTWVDSPQAKMIPMVDETELVTGRIWGGV